MLLGALVLALRGFALALLRGQRGFGGVLCLIGFQSCLAFVLCPPLRFALRAVGQLSLAFRTLPLPSDARQSDGEREQQGRPEGRDARVSLRPPPRAVHSPDWPGDDRRAAEEV